MQVDSEKHVICETCRFWEMSARDPNYGDCVRFPPTLFRIWPDDHDNEEWEKGTINPFIIRMNASNSPLTEAGQWCGEWKERQ